MMRSVSFRIALVMAAALLVLVFPVGGGFGPKANDCRLNALPVAHLAHRASDAVLPENCMEGIAHSLKLGYDGVEIDIHETRDHVFVLFHDDSSQRLLGIDGTIAEHSFAEVRDIPLRRHSYPTTSRIARLDSALARYADSLLFYIDMKVSGLDQADSIALLVMRYAPAANVMIASSSIPFITYLEFHHPALNTVLEGFDNGEEWTWHLFPKNFRPDFVSSFDDEVDEAHTAWLREKGLLANKLVYGADSAGYARMRQLGISRFIVDEGLPLQR